MAQAYRWTADYIFSLTMPQIIMINAAADTNKKRLDKRIENNRKNGTQSVEEAVNTSPPMVDGKRIDELTTEEYMAYHNSANKWLNK